MEELFTLFNKIDVVVVLIVIISGQLNQKKFMGRFPKFVLPLVLSAILATAMFFKEGYPVIIGKTVYYAGASMLLWEVWKIYIRRKKTEIKGDHDHDHEHDNKPDNDSK